MSRENVEVVRRIYEASARGELETALSAEYRLHLDELVDAGDNVLARCRQKVQGKASGVGLEQPLFSAWSLRDGKVVRMRMYHDEDEALQAVGLTG